MNQGETERGGVFDSLRRLGSTLLGVLQSRLELLTVELQEERLRLCNALLLLAAIAVLGLFTVATAAFAIAIIVWDEFGAKGLFGLSGLGLVATLIAYWRLRVRMKNWPFLSGTLAELKKDRECLESKK